MELRAAKSANRYRSLLFVYMGFALSLSLGGNLLAWIRIDDLVNSQKETYIPMFFDVPFTLSRSHADANYLEQTAQSLLFLRYNVSPESVKANHKALLRFFEKAQRPEMQDILAGEAKEIIDNNVTSAFYLTGMDVYPSEGVVDIRGTLQTWIGNRKALPEDKKLRLKLTYYKGITTINDFKEQVDEKEKSKNTP